MAHLDQINRTPTVTILPDMRKRITRRYDVLNFVPKTPLELAAEITLPWGTPDEQYPDLRLIKQDVTGQIEYTPDKPNKFPPYLIRVFEEIPDPTAEVTEVQVGKNEVIQMRDGRIGIKAQFLQFSAATPTPGIVDVTTAPGVPTAFMATEDATDDGDLRRIERTYETFGLISTDNQIKNNGALHIQSATSVGVPPATPSGYTIIDQKVENVNGLPTYTYTFAMGSGQIDITTEYLESIDQGATAGVTRTTIRYLSDPSVSSNPISTPSGLVLITTGHAEQDGYRLWTGVYANGIGIVSTSVETKDGGKLIIYHSTGLGAAPTAPASTIGGTVVLVSATVKNADGYKIYDYSWAEGEGQISLQVEYRMSPDQGASGITTTTIKFLTPASVSTNPTTAPSGSVNIALTFDETDGYRVWNAIYASGRGVVATSVSIRNNGLLYIYNITSINAAPATPSASIGGTVVLISTSVRNGTRVEDGTIIYDYTWAEGNGLINSEIRIRTDGLREQTFVSLGTKQTPVGVPIRDESEQIEGVVRYTVTCMQSASGATPTSASLTIPRRAPFTYPGRAKSYKLISSNGYAIADVFLSPPVETELPATVQITYQVSNSISPGTVWQPVDGAVVEAEWVGLSNFPGYHITGMRGYRSVDETPISITASSWAGGTGGVMLGNVMFGGTTGVLKVTGGPPDPSGNTYVLDYSLEPAFVSVTGTIYYRATIISATIPAQPSLPV